MARSKLSIAENIKKRIIRPHHEHGDIAQNVDMNFSVIKSVSGLSDALEKLSEFEKVSLDKLAKELHFIPLSFRQLQNHQERLFNNLIKMVALLEQKSARETDPIKKQAIDSAIESFRNRGGELQKNFEFTRRNGGNDSIKDNIIASLGLNPKEAKEKGVIRTLFSRSRRILNGKETSHGLNVSEDFEDLVDKYKDVFSSNSSELSPVQKADSGESILDLAEGNRVLPSGGGLLSKSRRNSSASDALMKMLLNEVTVIRKLVEGRVDFNPKTGKYVGENRDPDFHRKLTTPNEGFSKSSGFGNVRNHYRPDSNLVGKSNSNLVGKSNSNLVGRSSIYRPDTDTEDENNENRDRYERIDQDPFDEERFKTASSTSSANAEAKNSPISPAPSPTGGGGFGGGFGGALGGIFSALGIKKLLQKGSTKLVGRQAAKVAAKQVAQQAAKSGAKTGSVVAKGLSKVGLKGAGGIAAKSILKKLPLIGLAIGAKFAYDRLKGGDIVGAGGELLSGAASLVPGLGTVASLGVDAALAGRDISKAMSAQKNSGEILEDFKDTESGGSSALVAPVSNVTNNYASASSGTDLSTFIPSVRNVDVSFLRYQDKRMARIL